MWAKTNTQRLIKTNTAAVMCMQARSSCYIHGLKVWRTRFVITIINSVSKNRDFMGTNELSIKGCLRVIVPV